MIIRLLLKFHYWMDVFYSTCIFMINLQQDLGRITDIMILRHPSTHSPGTPAVVWVANRQLRRQQVLHRKSPGTWTQRGPVLSIHVPFKDEQMCSTSPNRLFLREIICTTLRNFFRYFVTMSSCRISFSQLCIIFFSVHSLFASHFQFNSTHTELRHRLYAVWKPSLAPGKP